MKSHLLVVDVGPAEVEMMSDLEQICSLPTYCYVFLHMKLVHQLHWRGNPRVNTLNWDFMALLGLAWRWEEEGGVRGAGVNTSLRVTFGVSITTF